MRNNIQNENNEEINENYLWLSLDDEGLKIVEEKLGKDFVETHKKHIEKEKSLEKKLVEKAFPKYECPDALILSIEDQIHHINKKVIYKNKLLFLLRRIPSPFNYPKAISFALTLVILIMGLTILLQNRHIQNIKMDNEDLKKKIAFLESKNTYQTSPTSEDYSDIIFSSFEESLQDADPNLISNLVLSKTKTISMDLAKLQNSDQTIRLIGYREDTIDDELVLQIVFQSNEQKYKIIVSPRTPNSVNLYKKAILEGKVRDIRTLENHLIALIGEPGIPSSVLNCFVHSEDTNPHQETYSNEETMVFDTNNSESPDTNINTYPPTEDTASEGLISSKIYEMEEYSPTPSSDYDSASSI